MEKFDIGIIGGGPGGYVAAIRAAQLGARVALIEKDEVGGTCLLRGCIPTKALLATAELLAKTREAEEFGVSVGEVKLDYAKVLERKTLSSRGLSGGFTASSTPERSNTCTEKVNSSATAAWALPCPRARPGGNAKTYS